jgi:hypothetical protein
MVKTVLHGFTRLIGLYGYPSSSVYTPVNGLHGHVGEQCLWYNSGTVAGKTSAAHSGILW